MVAMETMIECGDCRNRGPACGDCVVSVLLEQRRGPADDGGTDHTVGLDAEERAAVAALAGQGLVPPLRMLPTLRPVAVPGHAPGPRWRTEPRLMAG